MRHGEVDNDEGVLYGRLPGYNLTPLGLAMAGEVADYLRVEDRDIVHVAASPLLRAQESALPTALVYDLPIATDPYLLEASSKFEGEPVSANRLALAHPRNWGRYVRPLEPSWGEPYREILARMKVAITHGLEEARGHEALLVSHQLPIVTVQRFIEGKALAHNPLWRRCSLASLTSLLFSDNTLIGWSYAEPAKTLLGAARDVTPGASAARTHSE